MISICSLPETVTRPLSPVPSCRCGASSRTVYPTTSPPRGPPCLSRTFGTHPFETEGLCVSLTLSLPALLRLWVPRPCLAPRGGLCLAAPHPLVIPMPTAVSPPPCFSLPLPRLEHQECQAAAPPLVGPPGKCPASLSSCLCLTSLLGQPLLLAPGDHPGSTPLAQPPAFFPLSSDPVVASQAGADSPTCSSSALASPPPLLPLQPD